MTSGPDTFIAVGASWASIPKWAVRHAGDALAVMPRGIDGLVGIMVDVQGSGSGAGRTAASMVALGCQLAAEGGGAREVASLLNRALWTRRGGNVQASLAVAICAPEVGVEVAAYGSILVHAVGADGVDEARTAPAGLARSTEPRSSKLPAACGTLIICSDGIATSWATLEPLLDGRDASPADAETIMTRAVARDRGRPVNDMSVIVLAIDNVELVRSGARGRLDLTLRPSHLQARPSDDARR